jgi:hypothetical protein
MPTAQSIFLKPDKKPLSETSRVDRFLAAKGASLESGRLIFALDATASREPTWGMARDLTAGMIHTAGAVGKLALQLVYFRGGADVAPECVASQWTSDPARLAALMAKVACKAGYTQITRVLQHAQRETLAAKVGAVVLIGDMCESVNDDLDRLSASAVALGKLKTPVFAFQEGRDPHAEKAFRKIAEWSGGAYGRFDAGGVKQLCGLLRAAAAVAVGGVQALEGRKDEASALLLGQMKR